MELSNQLFFTFTLGFSLRKERGEEDEKQYIHRAILYIERIGIIFIFN